MPTPGQYFDDPREKELADRIWALSAHLPARWELHSTNAWFGNAWWPWANKRIIFARDWVTYYRELDGEGGVQSLNQALGGTDFTAKEIGDVEHFYVSAMMGTLGGPVGGVILNSVGTFTWEMLVGPARIAWSRGGLPPLSNIEHNYRQLSGPDFAGTRFGSFFSITRIVEHFRGAVPVSAAARKPALYVTRPGDTLSGIAARVYRDPSLWAVIYDANREVLTKGPDAITPGQRLLLPYLPDVTAEQLRQAKMRHAAWRRSP